MTEEMSDFFTKRAEGYDEHMRKEVAGCQEGYPLMAKLLPENIKTLLDLGCGTGLELEEIYQRFPALSVTGIDLTKRMLSYCEEKFKGKPLNLICGDYLKVPFGTEVYDAAVSFETLHHLEKPQKETLYRKICQALKPQGVYLECDYMAKNQEEEELYLSEWKRLTQELPQGVYYHYDIPYTVENQISMLYRSGFQKVEKIFQKENTVMLSCRK